MATTTNPPKTEVTEWSKVFHAQGTENYTSSLTFTKQLTVFALSTVTYLKDVFPKDCYIVESFAGHNIKILKTECKDELAQFVITSLTRAFEALDKKYLHQLAFCLYDGECIPGNLLEYHIFEYSYTPGGVDLNMHYKNRGEGKHSIKCSAQDVRNQTIKLFKSFLVTMEACPREQPSISGVSLIVYYNDDAPEGYQAPGYCHDQAKDPLEDTVSEGFEVGCVETPYHKTVAMSYYVKDMFQEKQVGKQYPAVDGYWPMTISLHFPGRVIENPELNKKKSTDDTTMQQYREAILSGEPVCEDMPLAGSCDVENMLKRVKTRGKRKLDACKEKPEKQPSAGVRSKRVKRSNK